VSHELHEFVVCPTCAWLLRVEGETDHAERPCPECGWTVIAVNYALWGDNCQLNIHWQEASGPELDLPDIALAVEYVDRFLEGELDVAIREQESRIAKLNRLHEMRMARREREREGEV
jgi:hypothetical protein